MSKIYQTGVVGIITGYTLKFANPIQINTGASSSPILVNLSIWEHRQSAKIQVNRPPLSVIQAAAFLKKEGTQDRQQPGTEIETDCPFVSFMELLLQSTVYGEWIFKKNPTTWVYRCMNMGKNNFHHTTNPYSYPYGYSWVKFSWVKISIPGSCSRGNGTVSFSAHFFPINH